MKKTVLTFVLFCMAFIVNAQEVFFVQNDERGKMDYYSLSSKGRTYIINNEINLYWNRDIVEKQNFLVGAGFKEPFLGRISHFDERNPLRRLVFYKDTQYLVILDNQLTEIGRLSLIEKFPEITASYASLTAQSTIWIFDENSKRWCILSSLKGQLQFVSNPVYHYDFLTSDGNYAYWKNATQVYGIDIYGKIIKEKILPENARMLAINKNKIVYQLNNDVFLFNTENNTKKQLEEIESKVEKVVFGVEFLNILTKDEIFTYYIK